MTLLVCLICIILARNFARHLLCHCLFVFQAFARSIVAQATRIGHNVRFENIVQLGLSTPKPQVQTLTVPFASDSASSSVGRTDSPRSSITPDNAFVPPVAQGDFLGASELIQEFHLPQSEELISQFMAVLGSAFTPHPKEGVLCVFTHHVCFKPFKSDSDKHIMHVSQIRSIEKVNTGFVVRTGLRVRTITGKDVVFSLQDHDQRTRAYVALMSQWGNHN
jgi:hypothetical protein